MPCCHQRLGFRCSVVQLSGLWSRGLVLLVLMALMSGPRPAAAQTEKLFIFQLNTFHAVGDEFDDTFRNWVDAAAAEGCNALFADIQWRHVEPVDGTYDFTAYEQRFDYIAAQGLQIIVKMNLREKPAFLDLDLYMMYDANGNVVRPYVDGPNVGAFNFHTGYVWSKAASFHQQVVSHFQNRYAPGTILAYVPVLSQWTEFEYSPSWGFTDFSIASLFAYREALQLRYGTIARLNIAYGTSYPDFSSIGYDTFAPPGTERFDDFMAFREYAMAVRIRQLADAVHSAHPGAEFGLQVGSMHDGSSPLRGTIGINAVADVIEWFIFDDAPGYDHAFTTDLARTSFPNAKIINEAFWPEHPQVSLADFLEHVAQTYAHGGTGVQFANWDIGDESVFANGGTYLSSSEVAVLFDAIRTELASPVSTPVPADTIVRTVSEIYTDWFSFSILTPLWEEYTIKSNGGADAVDVVYLNDYSDRYADADGDGLGDAAEIALGTSANDTDTDGDGLNDFAEVSDLDPAAPGHQNPFDPLQSDSTGDNGTAGPDGTLDGHNDWDGDGVSNADEIAAGEDPLSPPGFVAVPALSPVGRIVLIAVISLLASTVPSRRRAPGRV